jgi:hypothetical protein
MSTAEGLGARFGGSFEKFRATTGPTLIRRQLAAFVKKAFARGR